MKYGGIPLYLRESNIPIFLREKIRGSDEDLAQIAQRALLSTHIKSGEKVLMVADTVASKKFLDLFMAVANSMGIPVQLIVMPYNPQAYNIYDYYAYTPPKTVINAMMSADVIYAMTTGILMSWFSYHYYPKILENSRVLFLSANEEALLRRAGPLVEVEKITRKGKLLQKLISQADTIRVTSPNGTNVTINGIRHSADIADDGEVFKAGEEDHLAGSNYYVATEKGSYNGVIVIDDYEFKLLGVIEEPVKLTVKNDKIVKVEGGAQADLLARYIRDLNDPNFPYLVHIGFGGHPYENRGEPMDGAVIWAIGRQQYFFETHEHLYPVDVNRFPAEKGMVAKNHFNPTSFGCTVWLDDQLLLKDQKWVPNELR